MTFQSVKTSVMKFVKDEDGLTIVEYAVAGGLITAAVVTAFTLLGGGGYQDPGDLPGHQRRRLLVPSSSLERCSHGHRADA